MCHDYASGKKAINARYVLRTADFPARMVGRVIVS